MSPDAGSAADAIDAWLRQGAEGLRLLAENSRDVFYVTQAEPLQLLYVSPAYEEVWGQKRERLHADLRTFLEPVDPADRDRVAGTLPRQLAGEITDEEYRIVRADGSVRWIRDRGIPVRDADGRVYRIVGIAADVTDRRRTEEMLRLLDEASRLLGSSLDYQTTFRNLAHLVVPRLADICVVDLLEDGGRIRRLDLAHADAEVDARLRELARLHPPRLVNPEHPLERAIASGEPQLVPDLSDELLALIEHDAQRLEILRGLSLRSAMVVPLVARGRILGALTLVTSESGRRYSPEDLTFAVELGRRAATAVDNAALYEAALVANKAKADFLAVMSHELRTPLSTVIGYADLLEAGVGGELTPVQLEHVSRIKIGAWHLVRVLEGIISYARLEGGRERARLEPLELPDVLRECVALIEPVAAEKGLTLRLDLPADPIGLESDRAKLNQILLNLLSNAVKFTDAGEIVVSLRRDAGDAVVEVSDTGIGIPAEHLERIFDAFWQIEQPSIRRVGGTGVGLSVARRLARLLGGDVVAASPPAHGSTFTVRLPLASEAAAPSPPPPVPA